MGCATGAMVLARAGDTLSSCCDASAAASSVWRGSRSKKAVSSGSSKEMLAGSCQRIGPSFSPSSSCPEAKKLARAVSTPESLFRWVELQAASATGVRHLVHLSSVGPTHRGATLAQCMRTGRRAAPRAWPTAGTRRQQKDCRTLTLPRPATHRSSRGCGRPSSPASRSEGRSTATSFPACCRRGALGGPGAAVGSNIQGLPLTAASHARSPAVESDAH